MVKISENVSLKPYNTFGIDVSADFFVEITDEQDLVALFEQDIVKAQPLLILGGGSNMLFTKDFKGLVVKIAISGISYTAVEDNILVTAGAGVVWNDLVTYAVAHNFAGLENLALIPGTVGASPIQNIGAYGVEIKDVFHSCRAFEMATGEFKTFEFNSCQFNYRESVFKGTLKGQYIITAVTYKLNKIAHIQIHYGAIASELANRDIADPTIKEVAEVVSAIRVSKLPDPSTIGNAGSFFKNPIVDDEVFDKIVADYPDVANYPTADGKVKLAAGWLIEKSGFKGMREGQTGTWKNQALVLVNHGGATGQEVYDFSEKVIKTVQNHFGITLEREVNIL